MSGVSDGARSRRSDAPIRSTAPAGRQLTQPPGAPPVRHPLAHQAEEFRARGWWRESTLADDVDRHRERQPDRAAFISPAGQFTWRQYADSSDRLAATLLLAGLQHGERVATYLPDAATVHVAMLAAEKAGLVCVGIGARAGDRELRHLLGKTGASTLVTHAEHRGRATRELVSELRERGLPVPHHVVLPRLDQDPNGDIRLDGDPVGPLHAPEPGRRLTADELWLINSTSGTTGLPKCVMHAQNRWYYFHQIAVDVGQLDDSDVFFGAVPAPFGFGQWTSHVTPTVLGVPTVVMERFDAVQAMELIERERVTVLCAVSTQFIMMLNAQSQTRADLSSLRVLFTGGEAIPYERAREFEQSTGARVLNFYGSNESGFATATTLRDPVDKRLRTAGTTKPGTELRLYDDRRDVTSSRRGQPASRGPAICLGYLDDVEANAQLFIDGDFVLHADEAQLDEDGYLSVTGRRSDIIIRGGKNISAAQVEADLITHPAVALAAAVASPDPVFGERVCAYVELHPGSSLSLDKLKIFLIHRNVSKELLPERLVVLDRLPRASGGKLAKATLRDDAMRRFGNGE